MRIVEFSEWILNEATGRYVVFEVPQSRTSRLEGLDDIWKDEVIKLLDSASDFLYTIKEVGEDKKEGLMIRLEHIQDELALSIYGDLIKNGEVSDISKSISFYLLYPYFLNRTAFSRSFLIQSFNKSGHPRVVTNHEDSTEIKILINQSFQDLDQIINRVADYMISQIAAIRKVKLDQGDVFSSMIGASEAEVTQYANAIYGQTMNKALRIFLKSLISDEFSPDLEKLEADFSETFTKFKKMSDSERKESLDEMIRFQKKLLSYSNSNLIESDTASKYLIGMSRLLMHQGSSLAEIKKKIDTVK